MVKRPEFFGPILSLLFLSTDKIVKIVYTIWLSFSFYPELVNFLYFQNETLRSYPFLQSILRGKSNQEIIKHMIFTKSFWKLHNLDSCIVQPQNSLGSEVLLARKLMVAAFLSASMAWSYCETWDYRRHRHWEPVWYISLRNLWMGLKIIWKLKKPFEKCLLFRCFRSSE